MRAKYTLFIFFIFGFLFLGVAHKSFAQCGGFPTVAAKGSTIVPSSFCSPSTVQIQYTVSFIGVLPVDGNIYRVKYDWGDGAISYVPLTPGSSSYSVSATHPYPGPATAQCEYLVSIGVVKNSIVNFCTGSLEQKAVANWQTEQYNGGNVQLITPGGNAPNTTVHEVCEGVNINVIFEDQTIFNCNAAMNAAYPPNDPLKIPNEQVRWQHVIYNTPNAAARIPNVSVGPTLMPPAAGSNFFDTRGRYTMLPNVTATTPPKRNALQITAPGGFGAGFPTVGQEFEITILYWNFCNPYTNSSNPNDPPISPNPAYYGADNPPVERTALIRIVASPAERTVPDVTVCGATGTLTVTDPLTPAANWRYRWYSDAALTNQVFTGVGAAGTSFTPTTGNGAGQIQVGQRKHWWLTVENVAANSCRSEATEATLTRRPTLATPDIAGPQNLCPTTTGYTYTVTTAPADVTITDVNLGSTFDLTTQYNWVVPAGVGTLTGGQNTATITVTAAAATGSGNITTVRRYTDLTPGCANDTKSRAVTVRARPTVNISPDPAQVCEGASLILNGNPATGFGTITTHAWSGPGAAILSDLTIQQPIVNTATDGNYTVNYIATATFEPGVTCNSASDALTIQISDNPGAATVGGNQQICFPVGPLISNPLGGNTPSAGTGTWTKFSGPAGVVTFSPNANAPNATATAPANGIYVFRWTIVNGTCTSFADVTVDYGTTPPVSNAGTNQDICSATRTATLNGNDPTFATGTWTQVSGPGTTTFTPNANTRNATITTTVFGTYTYRWRITSGSCTPSDATVDVIFRVPPTATAPTDFSRCVDNPPTAPFNIPVSGTFGGGAGGAHWEVVPGFGGGTFISGGTNDTSNPVDGVYQPIAADYTAGAVRFRLVTDDPLGACTPVNDEVIVTIDRLPAAADAGNATMSVCGSTATLNATVVNTVITPGAQGTWTSSAGSVTFTPDANTANATANGLPIGTTRLTWTVTTATGVCGPSSDFIDVTRNAVPVNNNQTQQRCVDIPFGSTTVVALTELQALTNAITGGAPSTTVAFFEDSGRTDPYDATETLSTGAIVYTRVTRTDVTPACATDGTVTFTINSRPIANFQNPEFCEDMPVGSNTKAGISLTSFNNAVKNGVAANTVAWFTDAARTIAVATPGSVTANNGTRFYARVTDPGTTCTDTTSLKVRLNPIPSPNPLLGPSNVCADLTAATLYQLTVNNPTYTYIWSVPEPPFDIRLGGTSTFDLILLSFPVVVNPGQNISITEISDKGCVGQPNVKNITVDTSPPAITIVGPSAVCANEAGVIYEVANLANTTYAWTVPIGASIISGQGTFRITVNFGIIPGLVAVTPTTTSGCAGNPDDHSVAINPRPSLDLLTNSVCSDNVAGITLSGPDATSFDITSVTVQAGLSPSSRATANGVPPSAIFNDVFTNATGGPLVVQYTIVPVSALGCKGDSRVVNLFVQPEPVLDPTLADVICSTVETVNITLRVATGSIAATHYEITAVNVPTGLTPLAGNPTNLGIFGDNVLLDDRWENLTAGPLVVEYFVRPRNSGTGCIGDPAIPVRVTVNPEPQVAAASETICSGDSPTITLTTSPLIAGSTFAWSVKSTTGSISGGTAGTGANITDILVNNGVTAGSITYEVRATGSAGAGACLGPPTDVTITVNPAPLTNNVDQIVCSTSPGGNTFTQNLIALQPSINSDGSLTFTWHTSFADADAGINAMSVGTASAFPLANGVPVFVRVDNTICARVQAVTYTVHPTPSFTAAITSNYNGAQLSCATSSNGIITVTPPTNGTSPYLYSIDGGSSFFTSTTFNGLSAAGNPYVVRVRDARGCISDAPPLNFVAPLALNATTTITSNFNGQHIECRGDNNGVITVARVPGTGTGAVTYSIQEAPGNLTGATTGIFTGLTAGTYTFVLRDANNCQFTTASVTLIDPPAIVATAVLTTPVSCNGQSDGVITVTASGGTLTGPTYTYTISPGGTSNTTGVFSGLAANTYTVNVEDDNGCIRTSNSVTVTQPSSLTAFASVTSNYNGAKISCPGANNAVITVTANGGNGGFSYVLIEAPGNTTGNATGVYTGVGPGTYTVRVTDALLCNVITVPVNITDPTPLDASGVVSSVISCSGGSDGEIRISSTGGTGAYTFTMITPAGPSNATGIFSLLAQGTYDFQVRDLNNCTDVVQVILGQPVAITASAAVGVPYNGSQISCNGASDGIITVTASGGTGALTYVFDQFPSNLTGMTTGVFTGVPPGTGYTFTIRDAKNCPQPTGFVTAPVNVVQPPVITASAAVTSNHNGEDISCPTALDGQITVTASGGTGTLTYRLDQAPLNTSGNATGVYTGVGAGSYTVTVRDANSCFVITVPVTVTPPPGVNASAAVTSNYNGRQISCNGASDGILTVTAGGGVTPYSYILNEIPGNVTGATSGVFTGLPAGTYTVNVRDLNNCPVVTLPVTISEPTLVQGTSNVTSNYNGQQIRCVGASDGIIRVTGSGGTSPYTFISIEVPGNVTGASTGIFTGLPAGSYTFTVRDANNCTFLTPAVVISPPTPLNASALVTSNYHGSQISCFGAADGTITVTATGGTGALNYVFVENPSNTTGATSGVFVGIAAGGPYTFLVTDANTCNVTTVGISISQPVAIAASAAITSNHNGQHISCPTSTDGVITVSASGGTGVYVYRLDQAPLNTTGNSTGIYSNVGAGTYTVTVRDENGCFIVTTSVTVVPPPPVTASALVTSNHSGQQISCNGASDGEITVTAGGGVGSYTYLLNQIPANVTGASTGVFTGLPAGTYTVNVRDANNCLVTTTPITITQPAVLGATAAVTSNYNGQQISCNGASDGRIAITVSGGTGPFVYTSVEVPGNVTGASSGIFTGLPVGSYTFNVTDVNSCATTTASITISAPALMVASLAVTPLPGLNGRHVSCAGATDGVITVTVTVAGTGASTFTIDQIPTNASGRFSGVFTGIPPGSYTVTVRDANNCTIVTNSVTVDPTPPILATAAVTKNVNCFAEANGIITVTASGGTGSLDYLLIQDASNLTGASSGVFTGLRAGNYTVRVTDDNTCFVTTTQVTVTQPANLTVTIVKMSPYNGFDLSCSGASDGEIRVTATAGGTGPYTYTLDGFPGNTTGATSGIFTGLSAGLYTVTATDSNTGDPFGACTRQSLPVFINNPIDLAVNLVGFSKQICIGDDPTPITQISPPVGGIGDYRYQWEESTNGTLFTTIVGATSANFDPPPLTQTMYYRRLLSSGPASTCPTLTSDPVEIKVNPLPEIANVTAPQFLCENSAMIVFYDFAPGQAPFFFSYTQETINQSGAVIATKVVTNEISGDSKPVIQSPFVDDVRITVTGLRDFNGCVANPALLAPHNRYVEVLKNSAAFTATTATQCTGTPFSVQWNASPEVQYTFKWTEGPDAVFGPGLTGPQTDSRVLNSFNTTGIQSLPIILTTTNTLHLSNPAAPDCGVATHLENITIFPTIIPNIVVIEDKLCSGSAVQVTNSTAGGDFHTWTIVRQDGVVEPGFPITDNAALNKSFVINNTSPFNPATYEIRYNIRNDPTLGNGNCSNSATVTVDVYSEVIAKIGSPKDPAQTIQHWGENDPADAGVMGVDGSGKNYMRITFDNASTPPPPATGIEYTWVFSNNNANTPPQTFPNENADPFFYDYKNPGIGKRATLTVTNTAAIGNVPGGCSDTDQFIFDINVPDIVASFTVSPSVICLPDTIKTTNLSTPLYNVWTVMNESTGGVLGIPSNDFEPKFLLTEPGRYRISLKVRNPDFPDEEVNYRHAPDQFVDAYDKPFTQFDVSPFPDVFVPDQLLKTYNESITAFDPITGTSWPISYEWDFGDGTVLVSGENPAVNDPNSNYNPTHKYQVQDTYKILLIAYNDHGTIRCSSRDSVYINARDAGSSKVPNAFTPNPGGPSGGIVDDNGLTINDVFLPITKGVKEFQMQIFDRWGNLVFESKMQNQGWDGYDRNGNLMPAGVYVYKLVLRMSNDQRTTQVGDVTLIR